MTQLTWGQKTDVGRVRKMNQDSAAFFDAEALDYPVCGLFIVADGMGGHAGGEIASRMAVERLSTSIREYLRRVDGAVDSETLVQATLRGIQAANSAVWEQSQTSPQLRGMGTTCVCALIHDGEAIIGNVGDSRLYLFRGGELIQITQDHSLVQEYVRTGELSLAEARESRFRNVITRAIGVADDVEPDVEVLPLQEGDSLLLCSDGLTNMVEEQEIAEILAETPDPQEACERLITEANRRGGEDNITVIVVRYGAYKPALEAAPPSRSEPEGGMLSGRRHQRRERAPVSGLTMLLLVLVLLLAGALTHVLREFYRVTEGRLFSYRPPSLPVLPPPAPPPNSGTMVYDAPVPVFDKPVRGAPVVCDAAGNVYVVTTTEKVYRVAPAIGSGQNIGSAPIPTRVAGDIYWAADSQGYLYISSRADRCIYKYAPNGTRRAVIGRGKLQAPEGIAVDAAFHIYVADKGRLKMLRARSSDGGGRGAG